MIKKLLKNLLRIFLAISLLIIVAIAFIGVINLKDRPPSALAQAMDRSIASYRASDKSALYAIYGFSDPQQMGSPADLIKVGMAIVPNVCPPNNTSQETASIKFIGNTRESCGALTTGGRLECVAYAKSHRDALLKAQRDNAELLRRYNWLQHYSKSFDQPTGNIECSLPPSAQILYTQRLMHAGVVLDIVGNNHRAIGRLVSDLHLWRSWLNNSHSLIGKMIAAAGFRNGLSTAGELMASGLLTSSDISQLQSELQPLSNTDRSLRQPLQSELLFNEYFFTDERMSASSSPDEDEAFITSGKFMALLSPYFFKQQDTINQAANLLQIAINQDALPCAKQVLPVSFPRLNISGFDYFYNPIGRFVLSGGVDDRNDGLSSIFTSYSIRMCHLDGLTRIAALQAAIRKKQLKDDEITRFVKNSGAEYANPFTGAPMDWNPGKGLSFNTHTSDERTTSLLPWKP